MLKKLALGLTLVLGLALVGCGNNDAGDGKQNTADQQLEGNLIVSAAASLQEPMDKAYALYSSKNPNVKVEFNYGGSGALIQQIESGAPADLFISANESFMQEGLDKQLIDTDSVFQWLNNTMAVIVPANSTMQMSAIQDVANANKIALGNLESVPAGKYAKGALEKANLWAGLESSDKIVYAKDVKQVAVYVESGSADVGFVYSTDTVGRDKLKVAFVLDETLVDPIIYPAGIVSASTSKELAKSFADFLQTDEAKQIFLEYGFSAVK